MVESHVAWTRSGSIGRTCVTPPDTYGPARLSGEKRASLLLSVRVMVAAS